MPDISSVSHYPLKVIFAIHLILVTWGIQGSWCPRSAMLYNLLFFLCIFWAIHGTESEEPLQFALLVNVLSVFFDVITLAVYFPDSYSASEKFSAAFFIINMAARVLTSVFILRIGQARGGALATIFVAGPTTGFVRQDYEDIPRSVPQNSDFD